MTTALTTPTPPAADRLSATAGLIRWTLRLHRPALLIWTGLVIATALALLWLRGPLTDAAAEGWRQYNACGMASACAYDQNAIVRYKDVYNYTTLVTVLAPFLVAAWSGAALFGRELESGTAHLAWTQSASPARWLATKLTVPAAIVTAGSALLVLLHNLAWQAGRGRVDTAKSWYDTTTFDANGTLPLALALAALAVGALAALLLRRSLATLGAGVVTVFVIWSAVHRALPHLWTSVTRYTTLKQGPAGGAGIDVGKGIVTSSGAHAPTPTCGDGTYDTCLAAYDKLHAVGFYHQYHPYSHFWPLQLTASALVLALAALAATAAFAALRRRTA